MNISVSEIAQLVGGRVIGDAGTRLRGVGGIREAADGDLTFVARSCYARYLTTTKASAVLVSPEIPEGPKPLIQVANPYAAFLQVLQAFPPYEMHHPEGIHPTAVIGEHVTLGEGVALAPHTYVGDNCVLGDRVIAYPGAYIGPDTVIGADTVLYANVSIGHHCEVGARCIFHHGAVVGSDGFGFVPLEGRHEKIPQVGTVCIGDDVEVGANTAIDRATFGRTWIGRGTKIDNLVQIGHNTEIGEHSIVCGNAGISGSAKIGSHVTLAARAGVAGHIEIGDRVTVAALSGVTKSVEPGRVVSGFPAIDHSTEKRLKAGLRRVPQALQAIRSLERRIAQLEGLLDARETKDDR